MDNFEVKVDLVKWLEFARRHGGRRPISGMVLVKAVGKAKQKISRIVFSTMQSFVQHSWIRVFPDHSAQHYDQGLSRYHLAMRLTTPQYALQGS